LISGFAAKTILLVGPGYSREDLKSLYAQGSNEGSGAESVLAGKSIFNLRGFAWEVLRLSGVESPEPASRMLRQDYLRLVLGHPAIAPRFEEMTRLKRQPGFWESLDTALESVRMTALHEHERSVQLERVGAWPVTGVRAELLALNQLWSDWLEASGRLDDPGALIKASQILSSQGLPSELAGDEAGGTLEWFGSSDLETVEQNFLEELSRVSPVIRRPHLEREWDGTEFRRMRWHTIEDSAEHLGDRLFELLESGTRPSSIVVLIPDSDRSVRTALSRVLKERGISELDPRDPLEVALSERIKNLIAWMRLGASGFERSQLLGWLSVRLASALSSSQAASCFQKIHHRLSELGVRKGWHGIQPLLPEAVARDLLILEQSLGKPGGLLFSEVQELHRFFAHQARIHLRDMDGVFNALQSDLLALDQEQVRLSLAEWAERLEARLKKAALPVPQLRPSTGIRVVRMSQFNPGFSDLTLFVLGCPAHWLSEAQLGDLYFRRRERELLSTDFVIRSSHSVRQSRLAALKSWAAGARQIHWLEHQFEIDGSEHEEAVSVLKEVSSRFEIQVEDWGAHPRTVLSYALVSEARSRQVTLPALRPSTQTGRIEFTATELEHISKCPFMGVVFSRWKARSPEDPDLELWPTTSGVLLHSAVETLVRKIELDPDAVRQAPEVAARLAFQEAFRAVSENGQLRGWVRSPQLALQIERRAVMLLRAFLEKEFEFRDRAKTRLFAAEDQAQLRWEFQEQGLEFAIRGKADRIDECLSSSQNGLWVIDYKSGRQDLRGVDIREKGYRLQLAFYAVAAQAQLQRPVLGVQLVELTREARRSVGLFPKALNGKQPGSLTQVRSNNPSLFEGEPSELWTELEQKIRNTAFDFSSGKGDALPVMGERECDRCRAREVCGQSRREWVEGQA
jgi:hypothetical protein